MWGSADNLREQIERLTTDLAKTEARPAELAATRKVIDGLTPPDQATAFAETAAATVYQRIVTAFNEHPGNSAKGARSLRPLRERPARRGTRRR